jgi:hypothetical protein
LKEENGEVTMNMADFEGLIGEIESLIETVEILSDKNLMKQIRGSEKDIKEGLLHEIKTTDDLRRLFFILHNPIRLFHSHLSLFCAL